MTDDGGEKPGQCWWRGCQRQGGVVEIAGHRNALCDTHVRAITAALGQADRFEVRWGEWSQETLTRKRRRLADAQARLNGLAEEDADEGDELAWTERDEASWQVDWLTEAVESLSEGPNRHPLVSIRDLNDSPPPPDSD